MSKVVKMDMTPNADNSITTTITLTSDEPIIITVTETEAKLRLLCNVDDIFNTTDADMADAYQQVMIDKVTAAYRERFGMPPA